MYHLCIFLGHPYYTCLSKVTVVSKGFLFLQRISFLRLNNSFGEAYCLIYKQFFDTNRFVKNFFVVKNRERVVT